MLLIRPATTMDVFGEARSNTRLISSTAASSPSHTSRISTSLVARSPEAWSATIRSAPPWNTSTLERAREMSAAASRTSRSPCSLRQYASILRRNMSPSLPSIFSARVLAHGF